MKAREVMTRNAATCRSSDSLDRAAQLMWDHDCGCIPVVEDSGRLSGVITDRDICMAAYLQGRPLSEIPVFNVMSAEPLACSPDDSIESAEALMQRRQVRRVPVTENGRLMGMLSLCDIVQALRKHSRDAIRADGIMDTILRITEPPRARQATAMATG